MLEVPESLKAKVEEAVTVLREHQDPVPTMANNASAGLAPIPSES